MADAKYYNAIDWATPKLIDTCSIAFTTSEAKTTEKATAFKSRLAGATTLNPNSRYSLLIHRPYAGKAGVLTTKIYNGTVFTGTSTVSVYHTTCSITTTSTAYRQDFELRGLYVGTANKIKISATFAATTTANAATVRYQLYRL